MTGPRVDDPMLRLQYYKETNQPDEAKLYEQYLRETGQWKDARPSGGDIHEQFRSGRLQKRVARENLNDQEMLEAETPSYAQQALGGIASLARDIPGAEALQAGGRALFRGQSYRDARDDIRGAEDSAPTAVRRFNRLVGGTVGAAAIPSKMPGGFGRLAGMAISPAKQGMISGGLSGLLQSDPDAGVGGRAFDASLGALAGGATGKVADMGANYIRAKVAPSLGSLALKHKKRIAKADAVNYGRVADEAAAAGGTSAEIRAILDAPDIKPYVDIVRQSRSLQGASDAKTLTEAFKLMSEQEGKIGSRLIASDDFKAGTSLEGMDLAAAKRAMVEAAETPGVKPPLTMNVPASVVETAPKITPGREALRGPIPGAGVETVPFKHAGIRDPLGKLRQDLKNVPDEALEAEWRRLAELDAADEAAYNGVRESGYRMDYSELPRTEKLGRRGQEDLPDADGMVDPERLLADNKVESDYLRSTVVRRARKQAMDRIEREIQSRPPRPDVEGDDASFDFGANVKPAGPAGPTFQLRAQPEKVTPGVRIETPSMRVQTAPAEQTPSVMPSLRKAVRVHSGMAKQRDAMRTGADATRRLLTGSKVPGKKLETQSPEAFLERIEGMTPKQASSALEGVLGRADEFMSVTPSPLMMFGIPRSLIASSKVSPFIRALEERQGGAPPLLDLIRALAASQGHPSP
jgi:hypothetical protein